MGRGRARAVPATGLAVALTPTPAQWTPGDSGRQRHWTVAPDCPLPAASSSRVRGLNSRRSQGRPPLRLLGVPGSQRRQRALIRAAESLTHCQSARETRCHHPGGEAGPRLWVDGFWVFFSNFFFHSFSAFLREKRRDRLPLRTAPPVTAGKSCCPSPGAGGLFELPLLPLPGRAVLARGLAPSQPAGI